MLSLILLAATAIALICFQRLQMTSRVNLSASEARYGHQKLRLDALTSSAKKRECEERWNRLPAAFRRDENRTPHRLDPSDLTPCGALFNMLRTCITRDYGLAPLPNYYINRSFVDDETYRRAHIAFVHLPKTGGTSVEKLLKSTVRGKYSRVANCAGFASAAASSMLQLEQSFDEVETGSSALEKAILLIMGMREGRTVADRRAKTEETVRRVFTSKRTFGLHNFFGREGGSREFLYFVWFREPVSKVLSLYHYLRSDKGSKSGQHHVYSEVIARESNTLTQFVHHPHIRRAPQLNNHFVRLLIFGEFPEMDSQFDDKPQSIVSMNHSLPEIKEEHYLAAKRNIVNKFAFIGIMEEFTLSQRMLCFMLRVECPQESVKVNVNKHEEVPLGDKERKILEDLNYWDIRLYEDALSIFEKQKKAYFDIRNKKLP